MAIYCSQCGTQLEDIMNFCWKCGNPLKGLSAAQAIARPKTEYKQVVLDLSQKPYIQYSYTPTGDRYEKPQATTTAHERILEMLKPYLDEGWELDGSFDSAVDVVWEDVGIINLNMRAKQARVKLRRN